MLKYVIKGINYHNSFSANTTIAIKTKPEKSERQECSFVQEIDSWTERQIDGCKERQIRMNQCTNKYKWDHFNKKVSYTA